MAYPNQLKKNFTVYSYDIKKTFKFVSKSTLSANGISRYYQFRFIGLGGGGGGGGGGSGKTVLKYFQDFRKDCNESDVVNEQIYCRLREEYII